MIYVIMKTAYGESENGRLVCVKATYRKARDFIDAKRNDQVFHYWMEEKEIE